MGVEGEVREVSRVSSEKRTAREEKGREGNWGERFDLSFQDNRNRGKGGRVSESTPTPPSENDDASGDIGKNRQRGGRGRDSLLQKTRGSRPSLCEEGSTGVGRHSRVS